MIKEQHKQIFWSKVEKTSGCWLWKGTKFHDHGYGAFGIREKTETGGYRTKVYYTHRFVFEITKGEIPKGMLIMHSCDNRLCVNPNHLSVGSWKDNSDDMIKKGRQVAPGRKLTDEQIGQVRSRWPKEPMQKLANEYDVSLACIRGICRNRTWRNLMN